MKKSHAAVLLVAILSLALVGGALYFQIVQRMLPCPLCVLQRYAFIITAIACLASLGDSALRRKISLSVALLALLGGAAIAIHQLWVIVHPEVSCGIDPVQTFVNNLPFANWLPTVFEADGMCGTPYDPFLGLSLPQWSLTWMVVFMITLAVQLWRGKSAPASQQ